MSLGARLGNLDYHDCQDEIARVTRATVAKATGKPAPTPIIIAYRLCYRHDRRYRRTNLFGSLAGIEFS